AAVARPDAAPVHDDVALLHEGRQPRAAVGGRQRPPQQAVDARAALGGFHDQVQVALGVDRGASRAGFVPRFGVVLHGLLRLRAVPAPRPTNYHARPVTSEGRAPRRAPAMAIASHCALAVLLAPVLQAAAQVAPATPAPQPPAAQLAPATPARP